MSREAIAQTVAKMRSATDKGMSEMMFRKDAIRVVHQFADQVEADVADIIAENERLKEALKPVLDCITDGIILTSDESSCAEGFDECMNAVNAVDEAKRIYNGGAK